MAISHCRFAEQAAYLAGRCSSWAGECANNIDRPTEPMNDESLARFLHMLRDTADRIENMHNE